MLKTFITRSNRELSICDHVRNILSLMSKICMVFFGVFVSFAGNEDENQKYLFIEVSGRCGAHKMSVHCGPYKRVLH